MSIRQSRGQATVITVVFLTVLLGFSALAIDVGSWWKAKRDLQATADAAALAGAQALPENTAAAEAAAIDYADRNGDTLDASGITFSDGISAHDTINVSLSATAPGFFSRVFGIDNVTVGARASARTANVSSALQVAPIVVNVNHPNLNPDACGEVCGGDSVITLTNLHDARSRDAAGSFGLINLDREDNGSVGSQTLGDWIRWGFNRYMDVNQNYSAVPSAKFNSSWVYDALDDSIAEGTVLLFPVYDRLTGPGDNAVYHIIAWVGYRVTSYSSTGSSAVLHGEFLRRISHGVQVNAGDSVPDFGVRAVQLVN
jgi:Flp pilus assembly protein TadG